MNPERHKRVGSSLPRFKQVFAVVTISVSAYAALPLLGRCLAEAMPSAKVTARLRATHEKNVYFANMAAGSLTSISGRATYADGRPLAHGAVYCVRLLRYGGGGGGFMYFAECRADGSFTVPVGVPGMYRIDALRPFAKAARFGPNAKTLTVGAGQQVTTNLKAAL